MSQNKKYAEGYQEGMKDIAWAMENGGLEGVKRWLDDNMILPQRDIKLESLIAELKIYAQDHYEKDGWDVFVEAWDDEMIKKEIGTSRSFGYARYKIAKSLKIYADHRAEIEATAF